MDIATIIGWVAGVAIVLQATSGGWAGLYNGTAVLVVVGGGLAATLVAYPLREARGALGAVKNVLMVRPPESADMVERIVGYAEKARREGILSLEKPMADEPNMMTRAGIGLVGGAFARKLGEYHELEALAWKLVIEGVMAIQAGDNPRIIEHKLSVFLAPKDRPRGERKQVVAAPEKTPDIAPEEIERYLEEQRGDVGGGARGSRQDRGRSRREGGGRSAGGAGRKGRVGADGRTRQSGAGSLRQCHARIQQSPPAIGA